MPERRTRESNSGAYSVNYNGPNKVFKIQLKSLCHGTYCYISFVLKAVLDTVDHHPLCIH
jgi:hypothetical protein